MLVSSRLTGHHILSWIPSSSEFSTVFCSERLKQTNSGAEVLTRTVVRRYHNDARVAQHYERKTRLGRLFANSVQTGSLELSVEGCSIISNKGSVISLEFPKAEATRLIPEVLRIRWHEFGTSGLRIRASDVHARVNDTEAEVSRRRSRRDEQNEISAARSFGDVRPADTPRRSCGQAHFDKADLTRLTDKLSKAFSVEAVTILLEAARWKIGQYRGTHVMKILHHLDERRMPKPAILVWQWWQLQEGYSPDVRLYTKMMAILGKSKMLGPAQALLVSMRQEGCKVDAGPYNVLIATLGRLGRGKLALDVFRQMQAEPEYYPNIVTYGSIIMTLSRTGHLAEAKQVLSELNTAGSLSGGCKPNAIVYNTLIAAYGRMGNLEAAEELVDEMKSLGLSLTMETYTSLVAAYGAAGAYEEVATTWSKVEQSGQIPDVALYTALIAALGKAGKLNLMEQTLQKMRSNGVYPNWLTCCSVIQSYAKAGEDAKMEIFVLEVLALGLTPMTPIFNSILRVYADQGRMQPFEQTLQRMRANKCQLNRLTHEILLRAYGQGGQIGQMEVTLRGMQELGFKLRTDEFNTVLAAYARVKRLSQMEDTWEYMKATKCSPNIRTLQILMEAFQQDGHLAKAALFRRLLDQLLAKAEDAVGAGRYQSTDASQQPPTKYDTGRSGQGGEGHGVSQIQREHG